MSPAAEWDKIDAEPATIQGLYVGYICLLAAIPPLANLIGSEVFGHGAFGIVYRPPIISAVVGAVITYVVSLVSVFLFALVIDALATSFDGQKNQIQAFKVAAYYGTAAWVAGVLDIFPPLGPLVLLASLYGLYLLYLGLPKLMKVPQEKALGYTVVTIVVAAVLAIVVGAVTAAVGTSAAMIGGGLARTAPGGTISGTLHLPGANVDLAKLNAASAAMQASAQQMQAQASGHPVAGAVKAVAPDALKALLPDSVGGGFARTEVSSQGEAAGGISGSQASGTYVKGDSRITLEVSDLAAAGALASLGGALNVESSRQTATGYEKVGKVDGRMTTESFDTQAKSGKYSVIVADRFVVEANGSGVGMDDLKSAVSSVGFDRLAGLAKG
jgi:hypothetical protein